MKGLCPLFFLLLWGVPPAAATQQVRNYYKNMYDKTPRIISAKYRMAYQECVDHVKIRHRQGSSEDPRYQRALERCAKMVRRRVILRQENLVPHRTVV